MPTFRAALPGVNAIPIEAPHLQAAADLAREWHSDPACWRKDAPATIVVSVSEVDHSGRAVGQTWTLTIANPHMWRGPAG